ncbi:hypothetical protein CesoFtcFv8_004860 [Champsocephalus esox]|uniref:Uncharacterized protein n=1 Tax=Champsocephalus esox TaxID=159716 RepID=A0AAN8CQU5_9TELE|nr:hypothetical protein CesoFtcFv8_004860 [Champsocephalus esox]
MSPRPTRRGVHSLRRTPPCLDCRPAGQCTWGGSCSDMLACRANRRRRLFTVKRTQCPHEPGLSIAPRACGLKIARDLQPAAAESSH